MLKQLILYSMKYILVWMEKNLKQAVHIKINMISNYNSI